MGQQLWSQNGWRPKVLYVLFNSLDSGKKVLSRHSGIIAAGLLIRLLLMPFTIQGDIVVASWISNFIVQGHLNVYTYYFELYHTISYPAGAPNGGAGVPLWPPLFFLIEAPYLALLQGLHIFTFLRTLALPEAFPLVPRVFFFLKAWYLPFDFLGLVALLACLEPRQRKTGAVAWVMNPMILYVTYMWGQTDIIPASFMMVALYFAKRALSVRAIRYGFLSCLFVGFAASFKLFDLLLLPIFLIFLVGRGGKSLICCLTAASLPFTLMIPFVSAPFISAMTSYSGFFLMQSVSLSIRAIYVAPALYLAVLYYAFHVPQEHSFERLLILGMAVFSLLYGLSVWIPNWILWGLPFILLVVIRRPRILGIYAAFVAFYFVFTQEWGSSIGLGLLSPLIQINFPNLWLISLLAPIIDPSKLFALAYTGLGVTMFYMTYHIWRTKYVRTEDRRQLKWIAILLIPFLLAGVALYVGRSFFPSVPEFVILTVGGVMQKISADIGFFSFYFALLLVVVIWLVVACIVSSLWRHQRTIGWSFNCKSNGTYNAFMKNTTFVSEDDKLG